MLSGNFYCGPKSKVNNGSSLDHYKLIKNIKIGDKILTYNFDREIIQFKRVLNIYTDNVLNVRRIGTSKFKKVFGTHNQPFYIIGKGWVQMKNLQYNDEIFSLENITRKGIINKSVITNTVINKEKDHQAYVNLAGKVVKTISVYNLEVEGNNNFFIEGMLISGMNLKGEII